MKKNIESSKNFFSVIGKKFDFFDLSFVVLLVIVSFLYFKIPIFFMPDSAGYYNYLGIFYGDVPFSQWDPVRGPSFPLLLFFTTLISGKSNMTILILSYFFYMVLLITSWILLKKAFNRLNIGNLLRVLIVTLFYVLIILNPILFGYFHAFLTEFVATSLALVFSLFAWKWLSMNFLGKKWKYIIISIIFGVLFVFTWFLKQPYFTIIFFPMLIATLISIIEKFSLRNVFQRILTFGFSLILLILAIFCWDSMLSKENVNRTSSKVNGTFISGGILNGLSNFSFDRSFKLPEVDSLRDDNLLDEVERAEITKVLSSKEGDGRFLLLEVTSSSGEIIDKMILTYEGERPSTVDSLKFLIRAFKEHPLIVLDSYWANYLAAINVWKTRMNFEYYNLYPERTLNKSGYENSNIALAFFVREDTFMWIGDDQRVRYKEFYKPNNPNLLPERVEDLASGIHQNIYKFFYLLLPFISIFSILRRLWLRNTSDLWVKNYYNLIIILLLSSFLHSILHIVTGAIIDRYLYITFPQVVLGYLLIIVVEFRISNLKKCRRTDITLKDSISKA